MNRFLLALAMSAALTAPTFAGATAADMTCSAFMAMGHDDQMAAATEGMASDAMATDGAMSADDQMAAMVAACTAHPDMMAMDACT